MKVVTFLGTGNYQPVGYIWGQRQFETTHFPEALVTWLQPDEVLVMLTSEARAHENWATLQQRLAGQVVLTPIDIPSGRSELELWDIFERLTDALHTGDKVVFDITHAFRSLPLVGLLAAQYLRVAQQVDLQGLMYGAFEARDEQGRAPVFDLTPFLTLLDWLTATDRFLSTGNAGKLAELLRDAHRLPWKQAAGGDRSELPKHLSGLATSLQGLSDALAVTRPVEASEQARKVGDALDQAAPESARWARPFTVLLDHVRDASGFLQPGDLAAHRQLVHWYVERGQIVQAVTLAREWLVSWTCQQLGVELLVLKQREEVERGINQAAMQQRGTPVDVASPWRDPIQALADCSTLTGVWDALGQFRNDVAHCGMREHASPASKIVSKAAELVARIDELPTVTSLTKGVQS
jgi:hypothetical protein